MRGLCPLKDNDVRMFHNFMLGKESISKTGKKKSVCLVGVGTYGIIQIIIYRYNVSAARKEVSQKIRRDGYYLTVFPKIIGCYRLILSFFDSPG